MGENPLYVDNGGEDRLWKYAFKLDGGWSSRKHQTYIYWREKESKIGKYDNVYMIYKDIYILMLI